MKNVIVAGGGAAGMLAAVTAAKKNSTVVLFERNEKLGKKIYITGKGRCNITNTADTADFFDQIFENPRFAYSSVYGFDHKALLELLSEGGLQTKTERGGRVFPVSDKASDVTKALSSLLYKYGVEVMLHSYVEDVVAENGAVSGIVVNGRQIEATHVILATGGMSYPSTGSDGNGYQLAEKLGHKMIPASPALVGFLSPAPWIAPLAGLTLKNIEASLYCAGRLMKKQFGELLFTHRGISGPVILTLSCYADLSYDTYVSLDLKPALTNQELDQRILRDFDAQKNKMFKNSLDMLLPKNLAQVLVQLSGIDENVPVNQITQSQRRYFAELIKNLKISVSRTAGYHEAIITKGGVDPKQINPSTMESKLVRGLYLTGEMVAVHALTGGYNLQLAFSSGHCAGASAAS